MSLHDQLSDEVPLNFGQLPDETLFNIGSYLPSTSLETRRRVVGVDPYDPAIITAMLQLGIDPATFVAQERERQREARRIMSTKGGQLAKILNDNRISWHTEGTPTDADIRLEVDNIANYIPDLEHHPMMDEIRRIGLIPFDFINNGFTVMRQRGGNLFGEFITGDRLLNPSPQPFDWNQKDGFSSIMYFG